MTRRLIVHWRDPDTQRHHPVAELRVAAADQPPRFELAYLRGALQAREHGFRPFADFPDLGRRYVSSQLFAAFQNRRMRKSRPDYAGYLASLGLGSDTATVPELLGRSGGRRQTDHVETALVPEPDPLSGKLVMHLLVCGIRHHPGAEQLASTLAIGDPLELRVQPVPAPDAPVHAILFGGRVLGELPGVLSGELTRLLAHCVAPALSVARLSPPPALVQRRVLARLECAWPEGYVAFAGEGFEVIAGAGVTTPCTIAVGACAG